MKKTCRFIKYGDSFLDPNIVDFLNRIGEAFLSTTKTQQQFEDFVTAATAMAASQFNVSIDDVRRSVYVSFEPVRMLTVAEAANIKDATVPTIRAAADAGELDIVPDRTPLTIYANAKFQAWNKKRQGKKHGKANKFSNGEK